jgi:hypothetical protein
MCCCEKVWSAICAIGPSASSEVVQPSSDGTVAFGSTRPLAQARGVRRSKWSTGPFRSPSANRSSPIERRGRKQTFRIVGIDEADATKGLISFRSPLAQAALGAQSGDVVEAQESLGEIQILAASTS